MDKEFCKNLKEARLRAGLTQAQIAAAVGVAKNTYSNWETGVREPDLMKIKKLTKVLGVTGDILLGLEKVDRAESDFSAMQNKYGADRLKEFIEALSKLGDKS